MPYNKVSSYTPPLWLPGGHLQTIYPSFFRTVTVPACEIIYIHQPHGEYIEADFYNSRVMHNDATRDNASNNNNSNTRHEIGSKSKGSSDNASNNSNARCDNTTCNTVPHSKVSHASSIAILSHGMEGNSRRPYILGLAREFLKHGWDVLARNFKGCGTTETPGKNLYYGGDTKDLHDCVVYCLQQGYSQIVLTGVSIGGNQVLKYLGEHQERVPKEVVAAITFSVPCNLMECALKLDQPYNWLYRMSFIRTMRQKIQVRHNYYPDLFPIKHLENITTFSQFDDAYTAPLHGFSSAQDYWSKSSCLQFLHGIRVPALLVSALNDPFLGPSCYPENIAASHPFFTLETPEQGGHAGFVSMDETYWSDTRAMEFLRQHEIL